jgi:shikimate dehydrogenase
MKLYGLIGRPLTHSFSKKYFTQKFERENIKECRYQNFELQTIEHLPTILKTHADLRGLNVTIPYKKDVIPFLDFKNEVVEAIGACNCIKIENGKLHGYNTDVTGFQKSLQTFLKHHHTKALVLGTGGSSGAVQYALQQLGIGYKLVSRQKTENTLTYKELNAAILKEYTIVINTTPLGMFPNINAAPDLPYQFISSNHLLFDLIYNPEKTLFLQKGEEQGATISNGHAMLLLQAEESWRIWNS